MSKYIFLLLLVNTGVLTGVNIAYSSSISEINPTVTGLEPKLTITPRMSNGEINSYRISWSRRGGTLQHATSPEGPWEEASGSRGTSLTINVEDLVGARFFRIGNVNIQRPATLHIPDDYDASIPSTLVISLHGFSSDPTQQERVIPLLHLVDAHNFLYLTPAGAAGTFKGFSQRAWNDGGANSDTDDVAYIVSLVEAVKNSYNINSSRIYILGQSNGAFMSLRTAYEHSEIFAGVISQGGGIHENMIRQAPPPMPVHALVIHSLTDEIILYDGGRHPLGLTPPPIGALETLSIWAGYNGCQGELIDSGIRLDLHFGKTGDDTVVMRYEDCPTATVEHWALENATHVPRVTSRDETSGLGNAIIDWIESHPKYIPDRL